MASRLDGSRLLTAPWGLAGGHPGGCGSFQFGDGVEPFVNGTGRLRAGETIEIGPPAERDPAIVERDLADQRINLATATATYSRFRR
jgi:N-methylhydantoinase B